MNVGLHMYASGMGEKSDLMLHLPERKAEVPHLSTISIWDRNPNRCRIMAQVFGDRLKQIGVELKIFDKG